MEGFSERLSELIGGDRKKAAFARLTGVGEANIRQYLAGRTPGLDKVIQIAATTGVSIEWLATGEGPREAGAVMLQTTAGSQGNVGMHQVLTVLHPERDSARDSALETSHGAGTQPEQTVRAMQHVDAKSLQENSFVLLPKLNVEASAGSGAAVQDEDILGFVAFDPAWLRARHITPSAAHVITARGDSMEPTIRHGDLLIVDTAISMAVDSGVYAVVYNGLLLVKRLFLLRDGGVLISSDNKIAGRDEEIPAREVDQLHIAGRVMWFGRGI